jgi:predicted transcriptional regulator
MMENERSAAINIGGKEYELILTTRATKAIAGRYGGLENLGEKLMKSENFEMALDEIIWLITILANQSILIRNLRKKNSPEELLTEEEVELLTTPFDLAEYKNAITEAMFKGTKRNVESEDETPKNVEVG